MNRAFKGIEQTQHLANGGQCSVDKGIINPAECQKAVLERIYVNRRAHQLMEEEGGSDIAKFGKYYARAQREAQKMKTSELEKAVEEICDQFLNKSPKGGYTCVIKEFNEETQEHRIRREQRIAGFYHPNVVYTLLVINGGPLRTAILEYVPKISKTAVNELTLDECIDVGIQAGEGLAALHKLGVVHRDVKPDNLLINKGKKGVDVKVGDMGSVLPDFAKVDAETLTKTADGQILISPQHAAPEQVNRSATIDHRADIYSLGGTIYTLITRLPPNQAPVIEGFADNPKIALVKNLMLRMQYGPVAPSKLASSFEELKEKPTLNPLKCWKNAREKRGFTKKLNQLEMVLAGMLNPDRERRYQRIEDAVYDLKLVRARKSPVRVKEVARSLGKSMKVYVAETFADQNPSISRELYAPKPSMLVKLLKTAAMIGSLAAILGSGYTLRNYEPIKSVWQKIEQYLPAQKE